MGGMKVVSPELPEHAVPYRNKSECAFMAIFTSHLVYIHKALCLAWKSEKVLPKHMIFFFAGRKTGSLITACWRISAIITETNSDSFLQGSWKTSRSSKALLHDVLCWCKHPTLPSAGGSTLRRDSNITERTQKAPALTVLLPDDPVHNCTTPLWYSP